MEKNPENFPYKCFYSVGENEVYSFYRQAQGFRVPIREIEIKKDERVLSSMDSLDKMLANERAKGQDYVME